MPLLRKGNRLSITPVRAEEWHFINNLIQDELYRLKDRLAKSRFTQSVIAHFTCAHTNDLLQ